MSNSPAGRFRRAFLDMRSEIERLRGQLDQARGAVTHIALELETANQDRERLRRQLAFLQSDHGVDAVLAGLDVRMSTGMSREELADALKRSIAAVVEANRLSIIDR
jgi:chromosome segregation ATPase